MEHDPYETNLSKSIYQIFFAMSLIYAILVLFKCVNILAKNYQIDHHLLPIPLIIGVVVIAFVFLLNKLNNKGEFTYLAQAVSALCYILFSLLAFGISTSTSIRIGIIIFGIVSFLLTLGNIRINKPIWIYAANFAYLFICSIVAIYVISEPKLLDYDALGFQLSLMTNLSIIATVLINDI